MNILNVIFLWLTLSIGLQVEPYLIIQEKSITVNGNTSIGGFSCDYELAGKNDTLHLKSLSKAPYSFSVPVEAFQCGNFLLNKDFQATLQAKEYPQIAVEVLSLMEEEKGSATFTGNIKLNLVGKSKTLDNVNFCLTTIENQQVLTANFVFFASEFSLTPPKRLGGLIKAEDEMDITVTLVLQKAIGLK